MVRSITLSSSSPLIFLYQKLSAPALSAAFIITIFALVWAVMAHSFLKMATSNRGSTKREYREAPVKQKSARSALLKKELRRFSSSANYMLNCGLGTLFLPILGVLALIKADWLLSVSAAVTAEEAALIACAALCITAAMDDITAPSVSLEGKNLWLLQSLPVSAWQALQAKLQLHLLVSEPPVLFCSVCLIIVLKPQPISAVSMLILPVLFTLLSAAFGLAVNLKEPNLKWTDEIVPIQQSIGVVLAMFGGWGFIAALGGLNLLVRAIIPGGYYLLLCAAVIAAAAALLLHWLKTRGAKIFEAL